MGLSETVSIVDTIANTARVSAVKTTQAFYTRWADQEGGYSCFLTLV